MAYRTILLELVDDPQGEARIEFACRLAARFEAELVGIHIAPPPFVPVGYGEGAAYVGPEIFEAQRESNRLVRERVEASFRRIVGGHRLPLHDIYDEGDPGYLIAEAARAADLTLAVQPGAGGRVDALAPHPIDQILLGAGGPVLMLPRQVPPTAETMGRVVLVAWNGAKEAARALKDALPFCVAAERVALFAGGEAAAALLRRPAVRGIEVEVLEKVEGHAGAMLLGAAARHGADLLVMGAYGHSRVREIVLGGATREVLRQAAIPVLLSC